MTKEVFPIGSLDICLSNRCNLMCKYCYFDSINRGKPLFLAFEQIARAFDLYIGLVSVNGVDKISFAGAEPFLNYPLLLRAVRYIRSNCGEKPEIELFTNGTFLSPARVRELQCLQAKIVVSIDGAKQSNDYNRIFHRKPAASVFDCIMGNLKKLSKEELGRMCASMTVTAQTAGLLAANVRFLREFGFGEVQINLNILEIWQKRGIIKLKEGIAGLKEYYRHIAASEMRSFQGFRFGLEYILLKWDEDLRKSSIFKEISIGPDGYFYPCGLVSTFGRQKSGYRIGDLKNGFYIAKMRTLRKQAVDYIVRHDRNCGLLEFIPNPMLLYFAVKLKNLNPYSVFKSARDVFKAFYDELGCFLRLERFFDILASDAYFGDFEHIPPVRTEKGITSLRIRLEDSARGGKSPAWQACACSKGLVGFSGLAQGRGGIDLLLYSPGGRKRLVLDVDSVDNNFELIGALALYSLLKAGYLSKRMSVYVVCPAQKILEENLGFLKLHSISLVRKISDR